MRYSMAKLAIEGGEPSGGIQPAASLTRLVLWPEHNEGASPSSPLF
jgi:hypothetical protein